MPKHAAHRKAKMAPAGLSLVHPAQRRRARTPARNRDTQPHGLGPFRTKPLDVPKPRHPRRKQRGDLER
jgi:hypothetical protein